MWARLYRPDVPPESAWNRQLQSGYLYVQKNRVRQSLLSHGKNRDICVLEGVMGYYDGIAGISKEASAWDVADTTDTPAILILDCKGVSVSAVAVV